MATEAIRKEIHGYIDKADDRFINLVYAMMLADLEEPKFEFYTSRLGIGYKNIVWEGINP